MNLPISPNLKDFNLHILLKMLGKEKFVASVAELSDIQVTATTREEAIEQLQKIVRAYLDGMEVLTFPVVSGEVLKERENPWTEFIGMYEGDEDFAQIADQLRVEREIE
jgi:predicted RNase H-like HicB family nuclease